MKHWKKNTTAILAVLLVLSLVLPCTAADEEDLIRQGPGVYYKATGKTIGSSAAAGGSVAAGCRMENGQKVSLDPSWAYADFSVIKSGAAVLYRAVSNRKDKCVAVNAGHGTAGGTSKKTYSHPDKTGKVTGGTNAAGAVMSICVSDGMTFKDGTREKTVTLQMAQILREKLLAEGYDVLMIRDGEDVQLDNIARTVIANNTADIHIALHWDGDGLSKDKGVFYCSVPDALKKMPPVASLWQQHEKLGNCLIKGLEMKTAGTKVYSGSGHGQMDMDLTQTSYSTVPSVDIELGNQCSKHDDATLASQAAGLVEGVNLFFQNREY